jgi:hypothetical protein
LEAKLAEQEAELENLRAKLDGANAEKVASFDERVKSLEQQHLAHAKAQDDKYALLEKRSSEERSNLLAIIENGNKQRHTAEVGLLEYCYRGTAIAHLSHMSNVTPGMQSSLLELAAPSTPEPAPYFGPLPRGQGGPYLDGRHGGSAFLGVPSADPFYPHDHGVGSFDPAGANPYAPMNLMPPPSAGDPPARPSVQGQPFGEYVVTTDPLGGLAKQQ